MALVQVDVITIFSSFYHYCSLLSLVFSLFSLNGTTVYKLLYTKKIRNEYQEKFYDRHEDWDGNSHQIITWFQNTFISSINLQGSPLEYGKKGMRFII